jgi:hypothetical protein
MSKNPKNTPRRSFSNLDLGTARKERISMYCAQVELETRGKRPTLNEAVNTLLDVALNLKLAPAEAVA